jgi:acyl carrier protein
LAKQTDQEASDAFAESPQTPTPREKYEQPTTNAEQHLAEIWSELLGIDQIDIHDDFFDLGGHSLLATRIITRVHDKLGVRVSLRDVFDAPTIHQLAARIDTATSDSATSRAEGDREEMIF